MKKNIINLPLILLLIPIMSFSFLSAATIINTPSSSSVVGGLNYLLNVTVLDNVNIATQLINLTFYAQSSLTANSSWATIATILNLNTTTNNYTNVRFNTTGLEDANDYTFNVTVRNVTRVIGYNTSTSIQIDNTVPTAASSLTPTTDEDGTVAFSSTVTGTETTSCTLLFPYSNPGATSYAMTHSGNTCSHTLSNIPEGSYQWIVRASDETNTTDSSTQITNIDIQKSKGKYLQLQQQGIQEQIQNIFTKIPIWIIALIVIGSVIIIKNRK